MATVPTRSKPARDPIADLPPSDALSILANGPDSFAGRKIGILTADGADHALLRAVQRAATAEGALVELIAPTVGSVTLSDGSVITADQKLGGGPSVLYDAVVVLVDDAGGELLAERPEARDFVAARARALQVHRLHVRLAPLFERAGVRDLDDGCLALERTRDAAAFVEACRALRLWTRVGAAH